MKRGPIIYAALLLVALLIAYQTWTREEDQTPLGGDVVVWSVPAGSVQAIEYHTEKDVERDVRVERRSDERGPYLWGREIRTIEHYVPPPEDAPDAGADRRPAKREEASSTREFMVGEKGAEAFEHLSELRALRALGKLDDEQLEQYKLADSEEAISIVTREGQRQTLKLGGRIFGARDRYGLVTDTGEGYVIAEDVLRTLLNGEPSLRLLELHDYEDEDVGKATIVVGDQERPLVRTRTSDVQGREQVSWADAQTPGQPDQTMANFLLGVATLRPARYAPEVERSSLTEVVRVEYQKSDGSPLGWTALYQRAIETASQDGADDDTAAPPDEPSGDGRDKAADAEAQGAYYMLTEVMRAPGAVAHGTASRIHEDVEQIFEQ